jgi:hypothetical protein
MRFIQALGGAEEQRPEPADRVGGDITIAIPFIGVRHMNCHFSSPNPGESFKRQVIETADQQLFRTLDSLIGRFSN